MYGSIQRILENAYPDHKWESFKFARVPKFFWRDQRLQLNRTNVKDYLQWIGKEYCGIGPDGALHKWYTVTRKGLPPHAPAMLRAFGGLARALAVAFPEHPWNDQRFDGSGASRSQDYLYE